MRLLFSNLRIGLYRSSIDHFYKSKLKKIERVKSNLENFNINSVLFLQEFSRNLSVCNKNGGYKKFLGHWVWVNQKINYFPSKQKKILNYGGVPNFITEAALVCAENSEIFPNKYINNYRQKYTFFITKNKSNNIDLEQAISFNVGGADSFQHFLQDCLPIIAMSKKFLAENPGIPLLLPEPSSSFKNRDYFLKKIGISNRIIETNTIQSLRIKELYFWNFYPFNAQYCLPPVFYKELRDLISKKNSRYKTRSVILLIRSEKTRKFKNLEDVRKILQIFANLNQLDLEIVNTSTEEIPALEAKINRASVIIGIHGGSVYNAIFCQDDCTVIEFIPTTNTNSTVNFLAYSEIKYLPIPGGFDLYDETVEVSIQALSLALSKAVLH
jgi:capsular polysaccharide biosynthesis protein